MISDDPIVVSKRQNIKIKLALFPLVSKRCAPDWTGTISLALTTMIFDVRSITKMIYIYFPLLYYPEDLGYPAALWVGWAIILSCFIRRLRLWDYLTWIVKYLDVKKTLNETTSQTHTKGMLLFSPGTHDTGMSRYALSIPDLLVSRQWDLFHDHRTYSSAIGRLRSRDHAIKILVSRQSEFLTWGNLGVYMTSSILFLWRWITMVMK